MSEESVDVLDDKPEEKLPADEKPKEVKTEESAKETESSETHPLEPDGVRFKQVWARAKKAEEDARQEREKRLVAETELRVRKEIPKTPPKEEKIYSWDELEAKIDAGEITRAKAQEYREQYVIAESERRTTARITAETEATRQITEVDKELGRYVGVLPDLQVEGSAERKKVLKEYQWLVSVYGEPKTEADRLRYDLNACRTTYGHVDTLEQRKAALDSARDTGDTYMETGGNKQQMGKADLEKPPKDMSPDQVEFYTKLIKQGRMKDWKEVHAEWTYVPKKR